MTVRQRMDATRTIDMSLTLSIETKYRLEELLSLEIAKVRPAVTENASDALRKGKSLRWLAEAVGSKTLEAKAMIMQAEGFLECGDFEGSRIVLAEAKEISQGSDDENLRRDVAESMFNIEKELSSEDDEVFDESYSLARSWFFTNTPPSREEIFDAIARSRRAEDRPNEAFAYCELTFQKIESNDAIEALYYATSALSIFREMQMEDWTSRALMMLSDCHRMLDQWDKFGESIRSAIDGAKSREERNRMKFYFAENMLNEGQPAEVIALFDHDLRNLDIESQLTTSHLKKILLVAKAQTTLGDFESALRNESLYFRKRLEYSKKGKTEEKNSRVSKPIQSPSVGEILFRSNLFNQKIQESASIQNLLVNSSENFSRDEIIDYLKASSNALATIENVRKAIVGASEKNKQKSPSVLSNEIQAWVLEHTSIASAKKVGLHIVGATAGSESQLISAECLCALLAAMEVAFFSAREWSDMFFAFNSPKGLDPSTETQTVDEVRLVVFLTTEPESFSRQELQQVLDALMNTVAKEYSTFRLELLGISDGFGFKVCIQ